MGLIFRLQFGKFPLKILHLNINLFLVNFWTLILFIHGEHHLMLWLLCNMNFPLLQIFDFITQFLNQLLAEMRPFSKFSLYLLVNFQVSFKLLNSLLKFLILKQQFFSLFRLVLKFSGKLVVLQHCQPCICLQLLFF